MEIVSHLPGTEVYELGIFGPYSPKAGQRFCRYRTITDAFNTGYGGKWVNGDDTGNSWRLVLDGISSDHVARRVEGGYALPSLLALIPQGELLA